MFFQNFSNMKSMKLVLPIIELFSPWLRTLSREDEPFMGDTTEFCKGMPNWKAVGPDGLRAELLKLDHPELIQPVVLSQHACSCSDNGTILNQRKYAIIEALHQKRYRSDCSNCGRISFVANAGKLLLEIVASLLSNCCEAREYTP